VLTKLQLVLVVRLNRLTGVKAILEKTLALERSLPLVAVAAVPTTIATVMLLELLVVLVVGAVVVIIMRISAAPHLHHPTYQTVLLV
jgi:hypothetical protein